MGAIFCAWLAVSGVAIGPAAAMAELPTPHPNILFVIMDDVGIDQLQTFGYGGATPPATPNIDSDRRRGNPIPQHLVDAGMLAEPRGAVRGALSDAHQRPRRARPRRSRPTRMVAPIRDDRAEAAEGARATRARCSASSTSGCRATVPSAMRCRGRWAGTTSSAGWTRSGDPSSIDTSAGGVAPVGTYSCGYVPGAAAGGADRGACYSPERYLPASWRALVRTRLAGRAETAEASSTRTSHARRSDQRISTSRC